MSITTDSVGNYSVYASTPVETANSSSTLNMNDFFELMVAELQNQNMLDSVDTTQYISQLAQFSTLSQMQELTKTSQINYAVSLIGKEATVFSADSYGNVVTAAGVVDNIFFQNGEPYIVISNTAFSINDVVAVQNASVEEAQEKVRIADLIDSAEQGAEDEPGLEE